MVRTALRRAHRAGGEVSMHSCLYRGYVRHRRGTPEHQFRYSTSWAYFDLLELDQVISSCWLLSKRRFAPISFRRSDHFGDSSQSLIELVREKLFRETQLTFDGPIRLLTQFSHFGIYFSPLNVFYCFDSNQTLQAMIAEVTNTPWNQKHTYVLWDANRVAGSTSRYSHAKAFHVSPFMGMEAEYHWRIPAPTDVLNLSIGSVRDGERIFHADLNLRRFPMTDRQLFRNVCRYPVATLQILGAIYAQAFRLWMKKCQFYPHPQLQPEAMPESRLTSPTLPTSDSPVHH